jgi:spore germination protein YaaH
MIDYAARLALVQAAINSLLSGGMQSYEIDGQKVTALDLEKLTREESRLVAKVKRAGGQSGARNLVPGG